MSGAVSDEQMQVEMDKAAAIHFAVQGALDAIVTGTQAPEASAQAAAVTAPPAEPAEPAPPPPPAAFVSDKLRAALDWQSDNEPTEGSGAQPAVCAAAAVDPRTLGESLLQSRAF